MTFLRPELRIVILLVAVLVAVAFAIDSTRRRRALERIGHPPTVERMMANLSRRRRILRTFLWGLAITLCVAALAQPTVPGESSWRQRGIDVAVVIDFSKSMLAPDVYPSRLERSTFEAERLMRSLEADRVATVIYAGAAVHFPLTHDHRAAQLLYRGVRPDDLAPGSNLGEAMRVARCVLRPDVDIDGGCQRIGRRGHGGDPLDADDAALGERLHAEVPQVQDRARAIVVFTDGEDHQGSARKEIEAAVRYGIDVYIVGVGTGTGELIPELDDDGERLGWKKGRDGEFIRTRLDQEGLAELATIAGGESHYLGLGPRGFPRKQLIDVLKSLKKGDLDERVVRRPHHVFARYLFPAFLLLVIEACLSDRRRRVSN